MIFWALVYISTQFQDSKISYANFFLDYNDSQSVHRSLCKSVFFSTFKSVSPGKYSNFFWQQQIPNRYNFALLCSVLHIAILVPCTSGFYLFGEMQCIRRKGSFWLVENTNRISAHIFFSWIIAQLVLLFKICIRSCEFFFECIRTAFHSVGVNFPVFPQIILPAEFLWAFFSFRLNHLSTCQEFKTK